MKVPDEVIAAAEERYWVAGREQDSYAYVAEWARKEALKEAAAAVAAVEEFDSETDEDGEEHWWMINPAPFAAAVEALIKEHHE